MEHLICTSVFTLYADRRATRSDNIRQAFKTCMFVLWCVAELVIEERAELSCDNRREQCFFQVTTLFINSISYFVKQIFACENSFIARSNFFADFVTAKVCNCRAEAGFFCCIESRILDNFLETVKLFRNNCTVSVEESTLGRFYDTHCTSDFFCVVHIFHAFNEFSLLCNASDSTDVLLFEDFTLDVLVTFADFLTFADEVEFIIANACASVVLMYSRL